MKTRLLDLTACSSINKRDRQFKNIYFTHKNIVHEGHLRNQYSKRERERDCGQQQQALTVDGHGLRPGPTARVPQWHMAEAP